jgi:hypothetical protein
MPLTPVKMKPKEQVQGECFPEAKKPNHGKYQGKGTYFPTLAPPTEAQCLRLCCRQD